MMETFTYEAEQHDKDTVPSLHGCEALAASSADRGALNWQDSRRCNSCPM